MTTGHEFCTAAMLATLTASRDGREATFELHSCCAVMIRFADSDGGVFDLIEGSGGMEPDEALEALTELLDGDGWKVA